MFLSTTLIRRQLEKYDYDFIYTITDTDFTETLDIYVAGEIEAIIHLYSKKNLNVAANLAILLKHNQIMYGENINEEVLHRKYVLKPYIEDIKKYLLLT